MSNAWWSVNPAYHGCYQSVTYPLYYDRGAGIEV
jgi:hypothetical protein